MISGINSSTLRGTYAKSLNEQKDIKPNAKVISSKDGGSSKIERLKEEISSGTYKIDLSALCEKIADELI
jgi:anti-sigma28 factor (negative regulator of flagellin synthesis)